MCWNLFIVCGCLATLFTASKLQTAALKFDPSVPESYHAGHRDTADLKAEVGVRRRVLECLSLRLKGVRLARVQQRGAVWKFFPLCVADCRFATGLPGHRCRAKCRGGSNFTLSPADTTLRVYTKTFAVNVWRCVDETPLVWHMDGWGRRRLRTPPCGKLRSIPAGCGIGW